MSQSLYNHQPQSWIQALAQLEASGTPSILVTVTQTKGSVPRDVGSKMLVTQTDVYATLGGGHLEYKAIEMARDMLAQGQTQPYQHAFQLGASLGQCCGGMASLYFEPIGQYPHHLVIFGAGHVAKSIVHIMQTLPFRITWVDSRSEQLPNAAPVNVNLIETEDPVAEVKGLTTNSYVLVMTHDHQLDFELARAILKQDDFIYFGLIGSKTKRKRFDWRLTQRGMTESNLKRMDCPIGLPNLTGKLPAEIALSVCAQIMQTYQQRMAALETPEKIKA